MRSKYLTNFITLFFFVTAFCFSADGAPSSRSKTSARAKAKAPASVPAVDYDGRELKIALALNNSLTTIKLQNFGGPWRCTFLSASGTEVIEESDLLPEGEDIVIQTTRKGLVARFSNSKEFETGYKEIKFAGGDLLSLEIPERPAILLNGPFSAYHSDSGIPMITRVSLKKALVSSVSKSAFTNEIEALKATAIMMRTRLIHMLSHPLHEGEAFDICSDNHCMPYEGCSADRELVELIVDYTKGKHLTYKDEIIFPRFTHTCGGRLSSAKNIFKKDEPYHTAKLDLLNGKGSENCFHSPSFHWRCEIAKENIIDFLSITYAGGADNIFLKWEPISVDENGRFCDIRVLGRIVKTFPGTVFLHDISTYFGPNSIKSMKMNTENQRLTIIFHGMGQGEGVGMCLYGADGMAKKNQKYADILNFYYPGTVIKP